MGITAQTEKCAQSPFPSLQEVERMLWGDLGVPSPGSEEAISLITAELGLFTGSGPRQPKQDVDMAIRRIPWNKQFGSELKPHTNGY